MMYTRYRIFTGKKQRSRVFATKTPDFCLEKQQQDIFFAATLAVVLPYLLILVLCCISMYDNIMMNTSSGCEVRGKSRCGPKNKIA